MIEVFLRPINPRWSSRPDVSGPNTLYSVQIRGIPNMQGGAAVVVTKPLTLEEAEQRAKEVEAALDTYRRPKRGRSKTPKRGKTAWDRINKTSV